MCGHLALPLADVGAHALVGHEQVVHLVLVRLVARVHVVQLARLLLQLLLQIHLVRLLAIQLQLQNEKRKKNNKPQNIT